MIEEIRDTVKEALAEREGAGRADLVVLMHPDTRRELLDETGFDENPDRVGGVLVQYTSDVEEGDFELAWKAEVEAE